MYTLRDLQEMNSYEKAANFNEEEMQKVAFDMGVEYGLEKEALSHANELTKIQKFLRGARKVVQVGGGAAAGGALAGMGGKDDTRAARIIAGAIGGGALGYGAGKLEDKALTAINKNRIAQNLHMTMDPYANGNLQYLM